MCAKWCRCALNICAQNAIYIAKLGSDIARFVERDFGLHRFETGERIIDYGSLVRTFGIFIQFGPDFGSSVFGDEGNNLQIPCTLQYILHGHAAPVTCSTYLPTNRLLVTSSINGDVRVWDAKATVGFLKYEAGTSLHGASHNLIQTLLPSLQLQFQCRADGTAVRVVKRPLLTSKQRHRAAKVNIFYS